MNKEYIKCPECPRCKPQPGKRDRVKWGICHNGGIMLTQNEDGTFSEYDDSNDITISCKNEEQCEEVVELLKRHLKPVRPIILDVLKGDIDYECPLCGRQVITGIKSRNKYCSECGCKFDWGNIDKQPEA